MHCYLPIMWEGEGLKKRARTRRTYVVSEFVDVDIREIDETDVPVSVSSDELNVRYFEGRHWYPFSIHDSLGTPQASEKKHKGILSKGPKSSDDTQKVFFYKRPICPEHPEGYYINEHLRTEFNPNDFKEMDLTNRERAVSSCHERARSLILIDGFVWHSAASPALLATLSFQGENRWSISVRLVPMDAVERKLVSRPRGSAMFELETNGDTIRKILPDAVGLHIPEYQVLMPEVLNEEVAPVDFAYCVSEKLMDWWIDLSRNRSCDDLDEKEIFEFAKVLSTLKSYQEDRDIGKIKGIETAVGNANEAGFGVDYFERLLSVFREVNRRNEVIDLSELGKPSEMQ